MWGVPVPFRSEQRSDVSGEADDSYRNTAILRRSESLAIDLRACGGGGGGGGGVRGRGRGGGEGEVVGVRQLGVKQ